MGAYGVQEDPRLYNILFLGSVGFLKGIGGAASHAHSARTVCMEIQVTMVYANFDPESCRIERQKYGQPESPDRTSGIGFGVSGICQGG